MNAGDILALIPSSSDELADHLGSLPAKKTRTGNAALEALVKLAYGLYVTGDAASAKVIADPIATIAFDGSYEYWTWIEGALALQGWLAKAAGDQAGIDRALAPLLAALQTGTELQVTVKANVHRRFLDGQTLTDVDQAEDAHEAFDLGIDRLMTLFRMALFGGSETWPPVAIDAEVDRTLAALRVLIDEHGLRGLPPFK